MNTYTTVQSWIKENQTEAFFAPLDAVGQSAFVEGRETAVFLFVQPDTPESAEDPFYLYMPLVSLVGARDDALLEIMTELAEANIIGALPTGYRVFYERGKKQVYLGGQFLPDGLDAVSFRQIVETFTNYGRLEATLFSERIAEIVQETSMPDTNPRPAPSPFQSSGRPDTASDSPSYFTGLLKV